METTELDIVEAELNEFKDNYISTLDDVMNDMLKQLKDVADKLHKIAKEFAGK